MNTLDLLEVGGDGRDVGGCVQWPQCARERLLGDALTSDVEAVEALIGRAGLSAHPCLLTESKGLMLQFELVSGLVSVWVEDHGSPFLEALRSRTEELDPDWMSACLVACWPEMVDGLGVCGVRSIYESSRPEQLCSGWSLGSLRLAFVECHQCVFDQLRSSSTSRYDAIDAHVASVIKLPASLWLRSELESLSTGDAVVLARASGHSANAAWVLGTTADVALLVNVNWKESTMSWTGEMGSLDQTAAHVGQTGDQRSVDLSSLKIAVSFELEAGSFSLSVLQSIRPGQLIDLRSEPNDCMVHLVSGGRRLAVGRLVQIGDSLAVRIDQIFSKPEGAQHD